MSKPIALQLYSVREQAKKDFAGTIKQVADIGYAGVETAGMPLDAAKGAAKAFSDLGLTVCSTHTAFPARGDVQAIVEAQHALGSKTIVSGFGRDDLKDADGVKRAAEIVQRSAALLKPYGMRLGLHNHWWEFRTKIDGRHAFDLLMEQAPDAFSQLDVFWAANGGADPVQVVSQYRARLPMLHIKDGPVQAGRPMTAVGKGDLDMPAIIGAADPSVLEWLIVELDECATDMLEAVRDSYQYLVSTGLGHGRR